MSGSLLVITAGHVAAAKMPLSLVADSGAKPAAFCRYAGGAERRRRCGLLFCATCMPAGYAAPLSPPAVALRVAKTVMNHCCRDVHDHRPSNDGEFGKPRS
jgi:hypothetical protein